MILLRVISNIIVSQVGRQAMVSVGTVPGLSSVKKLRSPYRLSRCTQSSSLGVFGEPTLCTAKPGQHDFFGSTESGGSCMLEEGHGVALYAIHVDPGGRGLQQRQGLLVLL